MINCDDRRLTLDAVINRWEVGNDTGWINFGDDAMSRGIESENVKMNADISISKFRYRWVLRSECTNTGTRYRTRWRPILDAALRVWFSLWLFLGVSIAQADQYWISESFNVGKEGAVCRAIHKRLNELQSSSNPHCAVDAVETYPGFSEPPWEELDPREHFELLAKLMRYVTEIGGVPRATEEQSRQLAETFITHYHGQMQVWRTKLVSDFDNEATQPQREQTVIRLTSKTGSTLNTEACPGKFSSGWIRSSYIVRADLSDVDRSISNGTGRWSFTMWPILWNDKAVMIAPETVHWPRVGCFYRRADLDPRIQQQKKQPAKKK